MGSAHTLIVILGPTAVGKTSLSIELAHKFNSEIISADSRQFFKEIKIGTAKPTEDELKEVPHHFISNKSIVDEYNASMFEKEALQIMGEKFEEKSLLVMVGGSGLYINAVCQGFDQELPTADIEIRKKLNEELQNKGLGRLQEKLKTLDPEFYEEVDIHNSKRVLRALEVCFDWKKIL